MAVRRGLALPVHTAARLQPWLLLVNDDRLVGLDRALAKVLRCYRLAVIPFRLG